MEPPSISGTSNYELQDVLEKVRELMASPVADIVGEKAVEFTQVGNLGKERLFEELCFCILAANTSAEMALRTQLSIGFDGFMGFDRQKLSDTLKDVKYRFYNLRSEFITESRWVVDELPGIVKSTDPDGARDYLVENVKGIGYKEASHFLRNVGVFKYAILDKHILRMILGNSSRLAGRVASQKKYLDVERQFRKVSSTIGLQPGILDLYMWKIATGKIIK